jgi:DNA excision repair protein ERCC-2
LKNLGKKERMCPYFLARQFIKQANIIIYNVNSMLDPKIANQVTTELQKDCIVVFDECEGIDNACTKAYSYYLTKPALD